MKQGTDSHKMVFSEALRFRLHALCFRSRVSCFTFYASGQALLTTVVFLLFISTAVTFAFSAIALSEERTAHGEENSLKSFTLAEAGAEDVSYRIENGKHYSSPESLTINGATTVTSITNVNATTRQVVSQASVSSRIRSIQTVLTSTAGASFHYGVQIGDGGFVMENNSQVNGSIYSNGDIIGKGSQVITGDAFAAGSSQIYNISVNGNARAHYLNANIVGQSATSTTVIGGGSVGTSGYADVFSGGTINRNAYYNTSVSATTTVKGLKIHSSPAPVDLPKAAMPVSDTQLDLWEQDALAGGVISSPCPYKPADGSTIGPLKVNCDVQIDGSKIVTLAGTLWVAGSFSMENSSQLKLAPSFGTNSGIVIADNPADRISSGQISTENSAQVSGSGQPGSYVLLVSRNNSAETGGGNDAISVGNSSTAAIYYAPHGLIDISNSASLKEVTGWKIHLQNSAQITYESGLANLQFSNGPTGGYSLQSWKEAQ